MRNSDEDLKKCSKCKTTCLKSIFHNDLKKRKGGLYLICKFCHKSYYDGNQAENEDYYLKNYDRKKIKVLVKR